MLYSEFFLSYCVRRTLYNIYNKSTRFSMCVNETAHGICESVSPSNAEEVDVNLSSDKTLPSIPKKKITPSKSVLTYLQKCIKPRDIEVIPTKYLRKVKSLRESLFIVNNETARAVAENIMPQNFADKDVPLFEINPGLCLLTKYLLKSGVPKINLIQSRYWRRINDILKQYPGRIQRHEYDFYALWKYILLDNPQRDENVKNILEAIKPKEWRDGPAMRIIVTAPKKLFINQLIGSAIFQKGFLRYGRAEFYLFMRPFDFLSFTCDQKAGYNMYLSSSVLFQIIFETSLLKKLPRKDFLPWEQESHKSKRQSLKKVFKFQKVDEEFLYLVKVVPHQDLFEAIGGANNLQPLWHFVRQGFSRRTNRVIPLLERWIPGCGPRLIYKGMNIFTQFGELSSSEVLMVFNEFTRWPEYSTSAFLPSMETALLKLYIDSRKEDVDPDLDPIEGTVDFESEADIVEPDKKDLLEHGS